ncbi:7477_t:CDS:2 [Scutellospora calospora]|uniref:7477_t:CDS:1 n=1 Tax=Scutellospora calospora TaxID=85575 RepID=A0ACA9LG28_9GLOM|nr:7477_t:CDS:2 [Scutellospora calospora]
MASASEDEELIWEDVETDAHIESGQNLTSYVLKYIVDGLNQLIGT